MTNKNCCKLTNNELLQIYGGWQENIYTMVGHYANGTTYTITGISSNKSGRLEISWTCSCDYHRSEVLERDLEIFAALHLKKAHPGFCWVKANLDITRG